MSSPKADRVRARLEKRYPRIKPPPAETVVASGRAWVKVQAPKPWRPELAGEYLIGELVSRSTRPSDGGGSYGVITLRTAQGILTVTGIVILGLFESAGAAQGATVRVVFKGEQVSKQGRTYRDFELFLAKDELPPA